MDLGFGAGFEDLHIDLNTSSPSSQSTMTITDTGEGQPHGTFDSTLNFSFDVTGSVGGFYATIEKTVEVIKAGAMDLLEKPADIDALIDKIKKAKRDKELHIEKQTEERVKDILNRFGG